MTTKTQILSALFIVTSTLFSFQVYAQLSQVKFHSLDVKDGLTHNTVTCFVQDPKGFMWIGTRYGIVRYDGIRFKPFINLASKTQADQLNNITSFYLSYPYLWIGTQMGSIECFDVQQQKYLQLSVSGTYGSGEVRCLVKHPSGYYVIGRDKHFSFARLSAEEKVARYFEAHELIDTLPRSLRNEAVRRIAIDQNNLWIIANDGPYFYKYQNDKGFTFLPVKAENKGNLRLSEILTDIQVDGGQIHLLHSNGYEKVTYSIDSHYVALKTIAIHHINEILLASGVNNQRIPYLNRLVVDGNGTIWIGSTKGLYQVVDSQDESISANAYYHQKNSIYALNRDLIYDLAIDNTQCLWVGTYEGGINYANLQQKNFYHYNFESDQQGAMTDFPVRAIHRTPDSLILVGRAQGGITVFDSKYNVVRQFWSEAADEKTISSNWVSDFIQMDDDRVMVASLSGVDCINLKSNQVTRIYLNPKNKRRLSRVSHIIKTKQNEYWVGTRANGLYRVREREPNVFKLQNLNSHGNEKTRITSDSVNYLLYVPESDELLASTRKGLSRIFLNDKGDPVRTIFYQANDTLKSSLSSNYIWCIAQQDSKTYWLGTIGGGLNKITFLDETSFDGHNGAYEAEVITNVAGVQLIDVDNVLVDNDNNLWCTANGLFFLDTKRNQWKRYDINDGLQQEKFTAGAINLCVDGVIYLGSVSGVTYFHPDEVKISRLQPQVVLSDLLVRGKVVSPGDTVNGTVLLSKDINELDELKLRYNENDFSFEFASLHYSNPGKQIYAFKLDGFDTDWKKTDQRYPAASYSNLDFGKYIFKLKGTTSDGTWSDTELQLKIIIRPPWYKSIFAKVFYVIIFLVIAYLTYFVIHRWFRIQNTMKVNEEVHQMKLRFFTNISHELRTPLTLILSPLEDLLSDKIPTNQQKSVFKLMHRNTNRLLRFINELMEFRKVETGVDKLRANELNLSNFLRSIGAQFEPLVEKKKINFEYQIPADNLKLWADKAKLEKVVLNLLSNAFKFTPEGGVVSMRIIEQPYDYRFGKGKEVFWVDKPRNHADAIGILISDSGLGISKESLPDIFNRFYQLETANPSKHLGSGVGLAYVKSLIQVHHGNIIVASERNKGTDFMVILPLGKEFLSPEEIADQTPEGQTELLFDSDEILVSPSYDKTELEPSGILGRETKLLIVEDNEEMRQYLKSKFIADFQVLEAADGAEGQKIVRESLPDIIISDLMMPNKDGMTMTRELKEDIDTCHIPIILLTAKNTIEDKIHGTESGADIYVTKPFNYEYLRAQILNLIKNRKRLIEKFAQDALFEAKELGETKRDKEFFDKLYKFIEDNIDNTDLDSELICRHIGVGRTTLFNKVKGLTDQSLGQFIRSIRLKTAAKFMIVENMSVSEAAFRVGITSPSYFSRAFKEQFGKTPREFIEHYSEKS